MFILLLALSSFHIQAQAPQFDSNPITSIDDDKEYIYPIRVSDPSKNVVQVTSLNLPSWLNLEPAAAMVTTYAGSGTMGFADGTAEVAQFNRIAGIAVDASGNVFVADRDNHRIRKIDLDGNVTTIAGNGGYGSIDGSGTAAYLARPYDLVFDENGNLYFTNHSGNTIRKIDIDGNVTTIAGRSSGNNDGTGTNASFNGPTGIDIDAAGNLYVADRNNHLIRKITPEGVVTTIAGSTQGNVNGIGTDAKFSFPVDLTIAETGELYIVDSGNGRVKKMNTDGSIVDFTGSGNCCSGNGAPSEVNFNAVSSIAIGKDGTIYVSDYSSIRQFDLQGNSMGIAGDGGGYVDGLGSEASFRSATGLAFNANGELFVADVDNSRVRKLVLNHAILRGNPSGRVGSHSVELEATNSDGNKSTQNFSISVNDVVPPVFVSTPITSINDNETYSYKILLDNSDDQRSVTAPTLPSWLNLEKDEGGQVTTVAGGIYGYEDGAGTNAKFQNPFDLTVSKDGNIYVSDKANHRIRKMTPAGLVSTLTGTGVQSSNDGHIGEATFRSPAGIVADSQGNLFVINQGNYTIRKIGMDGQVTTFVGSGSAGDVDGQGTIASIGYGNYMAIDADDNVYFVDNSADKIKKITPGGMVTTIAGSGVEGSADGTALQATFNNTSGIAVDSHGTVYVADNYTTIRKISTDGQVTTLAGRAESTPSYRDGQGTEARLDFPRGLTIDRKGNIYLADGQSGRIRKVTPAGLVTTVAGSGSENSSDGSALEAGIESPRDLSFDSFGNLFFIESGTNSIRKISAPKVELKGSPVDQVGSHNVSVQVGTTTQDFTIEVVDVTPPVFQSSASVEVNENTTGVIYTASISDSNTGVVPTFSFKNGLDAALFDINAGEVSFKNAPDFETPLDLNQDNVYLLELEATDGTNSISEVLSVRVLNDLHEGGSINEAPVFTSTPVTEVRIIDAYDYEVTTTDSNNDYVQFSSSQLPGWLSLEKGSAYEVSTIAGNGNSTIQNGDALNASFWTPYDLTIDSKGNIFVVESFGNVIRKITVDGQVSTFAGGQYSAGFLDGTGQVARFSSPKAITVDGADNLYVVEGNVYTGGVRQVGAVRKITPEGVVSTVAGGINVGYQDGTGTEALFDNLSSITIDRLGNLYVADGYTVRKISTDAVVTTLAGSVQGNANGTGTEARFEFINDLTVDKAGNLYVTQDYILKKITPDGVVSDYIGSNRGFANGTGVEARFDRILSVGIDLEGNLLVGENTGSRIRKITPDKVVTTVAGNGDYGHVDGPGLQASFRTPLALTMARDGRIIVLDQQNNRVRAVSPGVVLKGDPSEALGEHTVNLQASDGNGGVTNQSFVIKVLEPPVITSTDAVQYAENSSTVAYTATATMTDPNAVILYGLSEELDQEDFNINATTGEITFKQIPDFENPVNQHLNNEYELKLTATSGGATSYKSIVIRVTNLSDEPPAFESFPELKVFEGDDYSYDIRVADVSAEQVTVTADQLPSWLSLQTTNDRVVTTYLGNGEEGYLDGVGTNAVFKGPSYLEIDHRTGYLYVHDYTNFRIRKVSPQGKVEPFVGSGQNGSADGTGLSASFTDIYGMTIDNKGNLYVAETKKIRKITPEGVVTTLAGRNEQSFEDGTGTGAAFFNASGLVVDSKGNLFTTDTGNSRIRKITPEGVVTTFAGDGTGGFLGTPVRIAIDPDDNLYVYDNRYIKKITPDATITTVAGRNLYALEDGTGTFAAFRSVSHMKFHDGLLYITDEHTIRTMDSEYVVETVIGSNVQGYQDGPILTSQFFYPTGIAFERNGAMLIADGGNRRVRRVSAPGYVLTGSSSGQSGQHDVTLKATDTNGDENTQSFSIQVLPAGEPYFTSEPTTSVNDGDIYEYTVEVDHPDALHTSITATTLPSWLELKTSEIGVVNVVAGIGYSGSTDGNAQGESPRARFHTMRDFTIDPDGNLFILEGIGDKIRKLSTDGIVSTIAGSSSGYQDGTGTEAQFSSPLGITIDNAGNLYVADANNFRIRKIDPNGVVTTLAGTGASGNTAGQGTNAAFGYLNDIVYGPDNYLYVADQSNNNIWRVTLTGATSVFAGNGVNSTVDGLRLSASFRFPRKLTFDSNGNLYVSERYLIRKIDTEGVVSTLAGGISSGYSEGSGSRALFSTPQGIAADNAGNIYVADQYNRRIRKITPEGVVTTIAGNGNSGYADGTGEQAMLSNPEALAIDSNGNLYVGGNSYLIQKVSFPMISLTGNSFGKSGVHEVTLKAQDSNGKEATQQFSITVSDVTAPDFTSSTQASFEENSVGVVYTATAVDASPVTFSLNQGGDASLFLLDAQTGELRFVSPPDFENPLDSNGDNVYALTIKASDGTQESGLILGVTVTDQVIETPNVAPVFLSTPVTSVRDIDTYTYNVSIGDENNDPVQVVAGQKPSWLTLESGKAYEVSTIAGDGRQTVQDGTGTDASFNGPEDLTVDALGNIYVVDGYGHVIRKIDTQGVVTTIAGKVGVTGQDDGTGTEATFTRPIGITIDPTGNLYVIDNGVYSGANRVRTGVRKITPEGVVTTIAGGQVFTIQDGNGTDAGFENPTVIKIDHQGNLFIVDGTRIRKMTPNGDVTTFAGGSYGYLNGTGTDARFYNIADIAPDLAGNLYVTSVNSVRKVTPEGVVSDYFGGNAGFADGPMGDAKFGTFLSMEIDHDGNFYLSDFDNRRIRKVSPDMVVTTIAGNGENGFVDGPGLQASLGYSKGFKISRNGEIFMIEGQNNTIRNLAPQFSLSGDPTGQVGQHNVTLTTLDGKGGETSQSFTIEVKESPVFTSAGTAVFAENTIGTAYQAVATMTDAGVIVTYGLGSNYDEALFQVNQTTGEVSFISPPDFETPLNKDLNNDYILEVIATANQTSTTKKVIISVTNVSDEAPVFESKPITSIFEGETYEYEVALSDVSMETITLAGTTLPTWLSLQSSNEVKVSTFAGSGNSTYADGVGTEASFYYPHDIVIDNRNGNMYVVDNLNHRIRKMDRHGNVSSFVGSGRIGSDNGTGTEARFTTIRAMTIDKLGNLYVGESTIIRKVSPEGEVTPFVGTSSEPVFQYIRGLVFDSQGNLFVADGSDNRIKKVTPDGQVSTFAGGGNISSADGTGTAASLSPVNLAIDSQDNLYFYDSGARKIRKVSPEAVVTTIAGSGSLGSFDGNSSTASFTSVNRMAFDKSGNLYLADRNSIRVLSTDGSVNTLAGIWNVSAHADGNGTDARFNSIEGLVVDNTGTLFIADGSGARIRTLTRGGQLLTGNSAGQAGNHEVVLTATDANGDMVTQEFTIEVLDNMAPVFDSNPETIVGENTVYEYDVVVTDPQNESVTITAENLPSWLKLENKGVAVVTSVAGSSFSGDFDGPALPIPPYATAQFNTVAGMDIDADGNIYVVNYRGSHSVRKISTDGQVTTLAGSQAGFLDGTGSGARFNFPTDLAVDNTGNIYVVDFSNYRIRKVSPEGAVSTLAGSGNRANVNGTGTEASFDNPRGIAVDNDGNVYVSDSRAYQIKKITPDGVVTNYAGTGSFGYTDGSALEASMTYLAGLDLDTNGNLYFADHHRVRKVTADGQVVTIAGQTYSGYRDGVGTLARFYNISDVEADDSGNIYVTEELNNRIRKITPDGEVTTVAGTGQFNIFADGTGTEAAFPTPRSAALDAHGNLYVGDDSYRIRKIEFVGAKLVGNSGENVGAHEVSLKATDAAGKFTLQQFTVTVKDTSPPVFTSATQVTYTENGTDAVLTLEATDLSDLSFSLSAGGDEALFQILNDNELFFKESPDYEAPSDLDANNAYVVNVLAKDAEDNEAQQTVTVSVLDVNENISITVDSFDPACFGETNGFISLDVTGGVAPYTFAWNNGAETKDLANVGVGTYSVVVTDAAGNTQTADVAIGEPTALQLDVVSTNESGINALDGAIDITVSGGITPYTYRWNNTATTEDIMELPRGTYQVTVTDARGCTITRSIEISTDNSGVFTSPNFTNYRENATSTNVYTPVFSDPVAFTLSLQPDYDGALFNFQNGIVSFVNAPDFENPTDADQDNLYKFRINATNGSAVVSHVVTVQVQDVAEDAVVITSNGGGETANLNVPENKTAVTTVEATLPGSTINDLEISLGTDRDERLFKFDYATKAITFKNPPDFENPLDGNGDNVYEVKVHVRPGGCPDCDASRLDDQVLFITVTDEAEDAVAIISNGGEATATINLEERKTAVTLVNVVGAQAGSSLTFTLQGTDKDAFSINNNAGQGELNLINVPDFENPHDSNLDNVFEVTVQVTDGFTTDEQVLQVQIIDVADEVVTITSNGGESEPQISVPENQRAVTVVEASMPGATINDLEISLDFERDENLFDFDYATKAITFKSPPDFENPQDANGDNVYEVRIYARPGGCPDCPSYRIATQLLLITVTDEAEDAIRIISDGGEATASITAEERQIAVTDILITGAQNANVTYSTSGTDADKFDVSNQGVLTFVTEPDFETPTDADLDNVYEVTVLATDGLTTGQQAISVTVTDVNEVAPVITSNGGGETANISVPENQVAVTTVVASMPGFTINDLEILIEYDKDGSLFSFDYASKGIFFRTPPDFENPQDSDGDNVYELRLRVQPGGCPDCPEYRKDFQDLFVTVVDQPEGTEPPVFTSPTLVQFLSGSTEAAYIPVASHSQAVSYGIGASEDDLSFTFENGEIRFINPPDFNNPGDNNSDNRYVIEVLALAGPNQEAQARQTVTIEVVEEIDTRPVFTSDPVINVSENEEYRYLIEVSSPSNSPITLSLGNAVDWLTLTPATGVTGVLSGNPLGRIGPNTVEIVATDAAGQSVTQTFDIEVSDATPPVITSASTANVAEGTNGTVYQIVATDRTGMTYSLDTTYPDAVLFNVDEFTGAISFVLPPDYENPQDNDINNVYELAFNVSDSRGNSSSQNLQITVTDEAELGPVFTSAFNVDVTTGTEGMFYTATVLDPNGVTFSLGDQKDESFFRLDGADLSFISPPNVFQPRDADINNVYEVTLIADDGTHTTSQIVLVKVINPPSPPVFTSSSVFDVPENLVGTIHIVQASGEGTLEFILDTTYDDAAYFNIDPQTGFMTYTLPLDFENPQDANGDNIYELAVSVNSSNGLSASQNLTITILDWPEDGPIFTSPLRVEVEENITTTVYTVTVREPESVTFSLGNTRDESQFQLSGSELSFLNAPDYENPTDADQNNGYSVEFLATDAAGNVSRQVVSIDVKGDETGPVITSPQNVNVLEGIVGPAYTITATDDSTPLTFIFDTTYDDASDFVLNGQTGEVTFIQTPDFENPADANGDNVYELGISVQDARGNQNSLNITITVIDVFEGSPQFTSPDFVNVRELTQGWFHTVRTEAASNVSYSFDQSYDDRAYFTLNPQNGEILFSQILDYENPQDTDQDNTYETVIIATDQAGKSSSQTFTINITDADEDPPIVTSASTVSVSENSTGVFYTLTATDESSLTFDLLKNVDPATLNDEDAFVIDELTGELSFVNTPDFENPEDADANNIFELYIGVRDGVSTVQHRLTITVTDVDEVAPVFTSAQVVGFVENTSGVAAYTAMATDANAVIYSLGTGNDEALFSISGTTGEVSFLNAPDFENPLDTDTNNEYVLDVIASDGINEANLLVTIAVSDVDEDAPVFTSATTGSIEENATGAAYTATASDASTVVYSLGTGNDESLFTIDSGSGAVAFIASPDFENPGDGDINNDYMIEVIADDGLNSASLMVTITVTNIDDTAPVFTSAQVAGFVENTAGVTAYTALATDANAITYSLGTGNDEALFNISGTTGEVSFLNAPDFENPLDTDTNNEYVLDVIASDGINEANLLVIIVVSDVDEDAPVFTSATSGSFEENATGAAYTATTTDASTVVYSLGTGNDEGLFTIDSGSGAVAFIASPNFENPGDADTNNDYVIEIIANDGLNTASQSVIITVTDKDEISPTVILSSTAADPVFASSFEVIVTFSEPVTGLELSDFAYVNGSGSNLQGSGSSYTLDVAPDSDGLVQVSLPASIVADGENNANEGSDILERTVEATAEEPTAIDLDNILVTEGEPSGTRIGQFTVTDPDLSDSHTLTLVAGIGDTDNGLFEIIGNELFTKAVLDFEESSTRIIRVRATDLSGLSYDKAFQVGINNVAEPALTVTIPDPEDAAATVSDMSFAETRVNETSQRTFTVTNSGTDGNLLVQSMTLPDGFTVDLSTFTLAAGASQTVNVTFAPTEAKVYAGTVTVNSSAGSKAFNIAGQGRVNNPPIATAPASRVAYTLGETITLSGYDPDGDAIEFEVVNAPANGTLVATGADGAFIFQPNDLFPEIVFEDEIVFRVVEKDGTLSSEEATYPFSFQITDEAHELKSLTVSDIDSETKSFTLNMDDQVFNSSYTLKAEYLDRTDVLNPVTKTLTNIGLPKSAFSINDQTASFTFTANKDDHPYLFETGKILITIEMATTNGFSDADAYILENEAGSSTIITDTGRTEDGEFFVVGFRRTMPENESVTLNLLAVEFGPYSLTDASIDISRFPVKGAISNPSEVRRGQNLVLWTVEYSSDTDVALLDSLEYSVTHPGRNETLSTLGYIEIIEVPDAPVIAALADQEMNEDEEASFGIQVTDPDSEVTLTAVSSDPDNVSASVANGELIISPVANYNGTVNISVLATEANSTSPLSDFEQFNLTILPVNDRPVMTVIDDQEVNEDGQLSIDLSATDVDASLPVFDYSIALDDANNAGFELNGSELVINPATNFYGTLTFSVTADDGLGTANSVSLEESFTVTVTPVNDSPEVAANLNSQTVVEGFPNYTLDLSAYFSDPETDSKDLTYTVSAVSNVNLSIAGATLNISSVSGNSGIETATVTASDGELSVTQDITFVTTQASSDVTVAKNLSDLTLNEDFGTQEVDLSGVFSDSQDANASFNYTLSGNDLTSTSIENGVLTLNSQANVNGEEVLYIIANSNGKSAFTSFNITITPVNDLPVLANTLTDEETAEDASFSKQISTQAFTDADEDALTYSASYTAAWLNFDAASRTFSGTPENADVGTVVVTVTATDPSGASATDTFDIVVTNTNDDPTDLSISASSLSENTPSGTEVGSFNSIDPDEGDDAFTYSLVSGTGDDDNGRFEISDNQLLTAAVLDFEEKATYSIRVRTRDEAEGTYDEVITITLENVNEAITDLILSGQQLAENSQEGTAVGTLTSTDLDGTDSFTYALVAGEGDADNALFEVSDNTLLAQSSFDFEERSTYNVRLRSTDAGGLSFEKSFELTVTNVNEVATAFSLTQLAVNENVAAETSISTFEVTDPDASDTHTYTLVSGTGDEDNASFSISDNALRLATVPNFEAKQTYSIRIRVTDAGGLSLEQSFNIQVNDLNEAPTAVLLDNAELTENQPAGTVVGTLTTEDEDAEDSHTISLVGGEGSDDNDQFEFNGNQLVTKSAFDFETKTSYSIRVKSTDAAGLSVESSFTIDVINEAEAIIRVADAPPVPDTGRGQSTIFNIQVFNDGDANLEVTGVAYPAAFSGDTDGFTIQPGASFMLEVTFSPEEARTYQGDIAFESNAGSVTVSVIGIGMVVTSIEPDVDYNQLIGLFPNPATNRFVLDLSELNFREVNIEIYNPQGRSMLLKPSFTGQTLEVDVTGYDSGMYLVQIDLGEQVVVKKLMIRK